MKNFSLYLLVLLVFIACKNGDDVEKNRTPEIKLEESSIDFTEDGGSFIAYFTSTDAWIASVDSDEWCNINPQSGNAGRIGLIVKADANTSPDDRTTTVILKSGEVEKTIRVSQDRKEIITLAEDKYTIDSEGGSIEIEVNHSVNFDITIDCDWITIGETRVLEKDNITFVVAENTTSDDRTGHITFTAKNGTTSQLITILQNGGTFEMYYTSQDGQIVNPEENANWGGANIISNTYENGKGILSFSQNISQIPYGAFMGCKNLKSIEIPIGVTRINDKAFNSCIFLQEVIISDSVTEIGSYAFEGCTSLMSITIPSNIINIGSYTFQGCNIHSVFITDIDSWSSIDFKNRESNPLSNGAKLYLNGELVENVKISNKVTAIGNHVFDGYAQLKSVYISDGVESIGEQAFYLCESLESVNIPKSITEILGIAFYNSPKLKSVYITDLSAWCNISFTYTTSNPLFNGADLYLNGERVENLIIPDDITTIKENTFAGCTSIKNVTISKNVVTIGDFAFERSSLIKITIPESVTYIGEGAFIHCESLESVSIPNSISIIQRATFADCKSLTDVYIGETVKVIDESAFSTCSKLNNINIPNSVVSINSNAFYDCDSLENIIIPENIKSIGGWAFRSCSSLKQIYCKPIDPPSLGSEVFSYVELEEIHVPLTSVNAYKSAYGWSEYDDIIEGYNF